MRVAVVCTAAVATGFALAGVSAIEADATSVFAAVQGLLAERGELVGIVLVEESLHRALPAELRARLDQRSSASARGPAAERRASPVLVPFPSPAWEGRGLAEQYVLDILRQAVGYQVKFEQGRAR